MRPTTTYSAVTGVVLARLRLAAGRNQAELGVAVGLNQSGWSKIERGTIGLTIETLALAAPLLHSEPSLILAAADRATRFLEARGVEVVRSRQALVGEAAQGQLSHRALTSLVEEAAARPG